MADLMHMHTMEVNPQKPELKAFVASIPLRFERGEGIVLYKGRNELRKMLYEGKYYVVKSFSKPHFINRLVYGLFRESKAKRSYEHALDLKRIGVGTPTPIGYVNVRSGILFNKSYFVTALSECTHTWADLFKQDLDYAEEVVREVGRVTARLHRKGLALKDYSRGNILFERQGSGVKIELVDLNRMYQGDIDMELGCKNFERLPGNPKIYRWLAEEYAHLRGFDVETCYALIQKSIDPKYASL